MPNDRQLEKRRRQLVKTAYLAAVLAGCTISTASYAQDTREWQGDGPGLPNNYNNPLSWTGNNFPDGNDQAVFGSISTSQNVVDVSLPNNVDRIYFSGGANAQSFNVRMPLIGVGSLTINGNSTFGGTTYGVENASGYTQSFSLMNGLTSLNFNNGSTITNTGEGSQVRINNLAGGNVNFNDTSSAGDANVFITNENDSDTTFDDNANAGYANITNNDDGTTHFHGNSDAYSATIVNNAGGRTEFEDTSSADRGVDNTRTNITNSGTGGSFGVTEFSDTASAGYARITNDADGRTIFNNGSTAEEARITNNAGGRTEFNGDSNTVFSSAGDARITNNTDGTTDFNDYSTAGTAFIRNNGSGVLYGVTNFNDNSTAGDAFIINNANGTTNFNDSSSAGNATIINNNEGSTVFMDTSQGGTATVINRGEYSALFVNPATLTLGHVRGSGYVYINGTSLTLDSTGTDDPNRNDIISGVITGNGGLIKEGENIVRLTGNNTYLGPTTINNGVLSIIGEGTEPGVSTPASVSDFTINAGGELRGTGIIDGDLTNNGGRLDAGDALGNRYAPLLVDNFTSNAGSTFVARVSNTPTSHASNYIGINDVAGVATLGGEVEVQVDQRPGTLYYVNNQFTLVTGLTVNGTFTGVNDANSDIPDYLSLVNEGGIVDGLSYETYGAYLNLRRNTLDDLVDGTDLTRNQRSAFNSLNNADFNDLSDDQENLINSFIYDSSVIGSAQASSLLSGDALTAFPVAAQGAASRFNQRILSQAANGIKPDAEEYAANRAPRMVYNGSRYSSLLAQSDGAARNDAAAAAAARRSSIWATIARAKEDTDSDGNGPGFDTRATEYQVGYNRKISDRTVAGISIGKSDADINIDDRSAKGDLDTTSIAAYFRHDNDDLYFSGLLSYSRHNIDSTRATGLFTTANGDYDARTIGLWGEVGKKLERGSLGIEPHISLKLSNTKQDAFSESGFGGLDVNSEKYNTRRLGLGVRVVTNSATAKFRPYGFVGYEREFGDEQAELTSSAAGLSSFNVKGSTLGKNIWALRLGTDARISDRFSVVGEIGASWRKNQDSRYVYGGVKYGW